MSFRALTYVLTHVSTLFTILVSAQLCDVTVTSHNCDVTGMRMQNNLTSDMENAVYNLTSDVTVTSSEIGSSLNLHITSDRYSGMCVQSFAFLRLCVAEILREK